MGTVRKPGESGLNWEELDGSGRNWVDLVGTG